jgi:hypothetical protein
VKGKIPRLAEAFDAKTLPLLSKRIEQEKTVYFKDTHQWMMEEQRFDFLPALCTCLFARDVFRHAATGQTNIFHVKVQRRDLNFIPARNDCAKRAGVFNLREALQSDIKRHAPSALAHFLPSEEVETWCTLKAPPQS